MKLVTVEQMRLAEQAAIATGTSHEELIGRFAKTLVETVLSCSKEPVEDAPRDQVLLLVGPGDNGKSALVAGRQMLGTRLSVRAYLWNLQGGQSDLIQALVERGVPLIRGEEDADFSALRHELEQADIVVDGLVGVGLARPVEGALGQIVESVNDADVPVVAVDLPTGVHGDTGQVLGTAVRADITVTMAYPKRGLYQFPGADCAGAIVVADVGIPEDLVDAEAELVDVQQLVDVLPERPRDGHKRTFGRVLVVAGSLYFPGAPYLVSMGAYRVGAGLVTLAPPRSLYSLLAVRIVEAAFFPLPEGERGAIGEDALKVLGEELANYQVLVLGCGLGEEASTVTFMRRLLRARERALPAIGFLPQMEREEFEWELPSLVLDGDALNALADVPEWWRNLPAGRVVLTPHPGEMARLLGVSRKEVLVSRIAIAQRAATTWGQVVVFKGAHTVIAHPSGRVVLNPAANPALATAGTGNVLAGMIAGFMAQGVSAFESALLGVYVHSLAGDILREEAGDTGNLAGDLLDYLPDAMRRLKEGDI